MQQLTYHRIINNINNIGEKSAKATLTLPGTLIAKDCLDLNAFTSLPVGTTGYHWVPVGTSGYQWVLGCSEMGGKIKKVHFTYWLTLFSLYFLILRTIYFSAFFDERPPSFAKINFFKA